MIKYLIRLDDACPTMNVERWQKMEDLLDKYDIRPMVGIIPNNADPKQMIDTEDVMFWQKALRWQDKNWTIALHGYDHCYISTDAGINPLWNRSEFAGVSLQLQKQKISNGYAILKDKGLHVKYFFAPSHTFDHNTIVALKECSDIRFISDTIALRPYKSGDFIYIPQIGGRCIKMPLPGIYTFCFHPNTMMDEDYDAMELFIKKYQSKFCTFDDLKLTNIRNKTLIDKFISWLYFSKRKSNRLK